MLLRDDVLKHSIFNNYVNSISGPIMLVLKKVDYKEKRKYSKINDY